MPYHLISNTYIFQHYNDLKNTANAVKAYLDIKKQNNGLASPEPLVKEQTDCQPTSKEAALIVLQETRRTIKGNYKNASLKEFRPNIEFQAH